MNTVRLREILPKCLVKKSPDINHIPEGVIVIDVYFQLIGVDLNRAGQYHEELTQLLVQWPGNSWGIEIPPLDQGVNYMQAGAAIGDQLLALMLFAVGQALGFWNVITPHTQGLTGTKAREEANQGGVKTDGYRVVDK